MNTPTNPPIVPRATWLAARQKHLAREKELTRLHEQIMAERRQLPWVKVEKSYVFDGPQGPVTLSGLFRGRSQLIVYHFMFGPEWEQGCPSCCFVSDHVDSARQHFENHDVAYAAVSRAPLEKIEPFRKRMGWHFPWVSSGCNSFNFDYHVSFTAEQMEKGGATYNYAPTSPGLPFDELPGASVFVRGEDGAIYHTYSTYTRGLDPLINTHNFLDLTPKGRNEGSTMDWVRYHDRYAEDGGKATCCGGVEGVVSAMGKKEAMAP